MDDLQDSLHCSVFFFFFTQNTCVLTYIKHFPCISTVVTIKVHFTGSVKLRNLAKATRWVKKADLLQTQRSTLLTSTLWYLSQI